MAGLELADVLAQLGRALVQRVAPSRVRGLLVQCDGALRSRHALALLGQLRVERRRAWRVRRRRRAGRSPARASAASPRRTSSRSRSTSVRWTFR